MKKRVNNQGVTLIALVVTIIVLLILAGITILTLTGENGILGKSQTAKEETNEKTATEIMNLKITNVQIQSYAETEKMPTLQYLADRLCEDNEMEYVLKESQKKQAKLNGKIDVNDADFIYTKLEAYPYEFKIDGNLRLASIDGVNVAENDTNYDDLKSRIDAMEIALKSVQTENTNLRNELNTLKNETIVNKRIKLMKGDPISIPTTTQYIEGDLADIQLLDSIREYKYLEIQVDRYNSFGGYASSNTVFIATEQLEYNNSNTVNWCDNSTFGVKSQMVSPNECTIICWLKNDKLLHVGVAMEGNSQNTSMRIRNIYGIK